MDFLEKIIQIPYLLPMISDKSMHNFIDAQNVEKEVEQQFDDTQNRVVRVVTYTKVSPPPSGPPSDALSSGSEQSAAAPDPAVAAGTNTSNDTSTSAGPPSSSTEQKLRHLVNLIF